MSEQGSGSSGYGFGYAAPAVPPPVAMYELRPLSTGEVLDRTFTLYRRRFWLFCGISAAAAAFQVLTALVQLIFFSTPGRMASAKDAATALIGAGVAILASLVYFAAYSVAQAATVSAVLAVYLGHETSFRLALKSVRKSWWRFVLILLWQFWSMFWIPFVLLVPAIVLIATKVTGMTVLGGLLVFAACASLVYGLIAYIRNALAIAASVMEGLKVRQAMRRSKTLAAGNKGRIFLLMLLLWALSIVAGVLQAPILMVIGLHPVGRHFAAQGLSMLIAFVTRSLIGPVGAIGFCLFYIDARVRKEGFDIEALMDPTLGSGVPKPATAPAEFLPSGFAPSGFTAEPPSASPFSPSGLTAASSPFPPSSFTAAPLSVAPPPTESPFAPSEFTAPSNTAAASDPPHEPAAEAEPDEDHG